MSGNSLKAERPNQLGGGGSTPTFPLQFVSIPKAQATELIIAHHYLHRKCPISWSFGIEVNGQILGVLTVGKPMWSVACGVVGEKKVDLECPDARWRHVYELNRLWIADSVTEHCIESKFVGWVLRQLRKINPNLILVSYADGAITNPVTGKNHVGVVYKALGFIYTGLNAEFTDITLKGYGDHRSVPKKLQGEKVGNRRAWASAPSVIRKPRSRKHRYVWFADPKDKSLLGWKALPYPKQPAA